MQQTLSNLFSTEYTERNIHRFISETTFHRIAEGTSSIVFSDSDNKIVLKILLSHSRIKSQYKNIIQQYSILKYIKNWIKKDTPHFLEILKKIIRKIAHSYLSADDAIDSLAGYRIGMQYLSHQTIPTRILENFDWNTIALENKIPNFHKQKINAVIIQKRISAKNLLLHQLIKIEQNNHLSAIYPLFESIFQYQKLHLWTNQIFDLDKGVNLFKNYALPKNNQIILYDWDSLCSDWKKIHPFIVKTRKYAFDLCHYVRKQESFSPTCLSEYGFDNHLAETLYQASLHLENLQFMQEMCLIFLDIIHFYYNPELLSPYWPNNPA